MRPLQFEGRFTCRLCDYIDPDALFHQNRPGNGWDTVKTIRKNSEFDNYTKWWPFFVEKTSDLSLNNVFSCIPILNFVENGQETAENDEGAEEQRNVAKNRISARVMSSYQMASKHL